MLIVAWIFYHSCLDLLYTLLLLPHCQNVHFIVATLLSVVSQFPLYAKDDFEGIAAVMQGLLTLKKSHRPLYFARIREIKIRAI